MKEREKEGGGKKQKKGIKDRIKEKKERGVK